MSGCEVWDVVKFPCPCGSQPVQETCLGLVVAVHPGKKTPSLVWVLMIASADNQRWDGDVEISFPEPTGVTVPVVVRTVNIVTLEQDQAEKIGRLSLVDRRRVLKQVSDRLAVAWFSP